MPTGSKPMLGSSKITSSGLFSKCLSDADALLHAFAVFSDKVVFSAF